MRIPQSRSASNSAGVSICVSAPEHVEFLDDVILVYRRWGKLYDATFSTIQVSVDAGV